MTDAPDEKKPQELRYVAEVFGRYSKTNPGKEEKVKRGPWGIFGTVTRNDTWWEIGGSFGTNEGGNLDLSTVAEALARTQKLRDDGDKRLAGLLGAPQPECIYNSSIATELWIGTAEQFEPRPSDPAKLWARNGELGAIKLRGGEITQAALEAFVARHDTPDIRAIKQQAEVEAAIAAAVAPASPKPLKAIRLKGNAP